MTTEPKPTLSLHRKLAQVMYEVERIPKRGKAPAAMGGFDFVQVGDAADVIRKALAEHNVSMLPSSIEMVGETEHPTSSGKMMTTMTVRTTWTLTDGESGETAIIQSMGSGGDMGDKAAPKAQSNAMKYALLMGFLLSTGDDPEMSDSSDRRAKQPDRPPAESSPDAAQQGERGDTEEMVGRVRRRGIVRKGSAEGYKLDAQLGPDGHAFGFKLEIDGEKNIPQCLVAGPLGESVYMAEAEHPERLLGKVATVAGILYQVKREGAPYSWYRLHVDLMETEDWILPAPAEDGPPDDVVLPGEHEAPTAPLFSDAA